LIEKERMKIVDCPQKLSDLWDNREVQFVEMMKIVVDISRGVIAIDGDMHADLEELLLQNGSLQSDLWGANIYPEQTGDNFLEYTSFINIRPSDDNRSMEVMDALSRAKISKIVNRLCVR